jgi:hypothetical protein
MELIGSIEADFQGASEYSSGGIGPLFKSTRIEAPFAVHELAYRILGAFQKLGVKRVDALFFDEQPVYQDPEGEEDNIAAIIEDLGAEPADDEYTSLYITLTHDDETFAHTFSVEASADYPDDEFGLRVVDTAQPLDDEPIDLEDEGAADAVADRLAAMEADDREDKLLAQLEAFLKRVQAGLHKELALEEPELALWVSEGGAYYESSTAEERVAAETIANDA